MDVASTKVLAMALLGGGSLILGFIPLKLRRFMGWSDRGKHSRRKNIATSILLCFGAGVLVATSFIHILPEVRDGFQHSCYDFGRLPIAEFFFCCGFFLIYFIEELVHAAVPSTPEAELRSALKRIGSMTSSFSRRSKVGSTTPVMKKASKDETGFNDAEMQAVTNQMVSLDEVDIETSPTGNGAGEQTDGNGSESETPVGTYNPKYRVKLNQSVHKMFPNYHPPDKKKIEPRNSKCFAKNSKVCSVSVRDFVTVAALSFHSIFEGLAVGLEPTTEDVWQLFGAIATHKFVIVFCVGLELATNDTKLMSFIAYMTTFCLASPLGIGVGIAITESALLTNPTQHSLTVNALQGISAGTLLYVVVFEILQREKNKSVSGLLQLTFLLIGFAVMVCIDVFGGHVHNHDHVSDFHHHNCSIPIISQVQADPHGHGDQHDELPHPLHNHEHGDLTLEEKLLKKTFGVKDPNLAEQFHSHDSHFKDFHGSHVPEQDLPPPTIEKNTSKLKMNVSSKRIMKIA